MDDQYLLPLLGVFVGWVLTTISAGFKERNQRKQLVGQLLTKLIRVERQTETLIQASENTKDFTDDWERYEPIRQYILSTHFLEPESVRTDLKNAIDNCAPYFPNLAIDVEDCYERLLKNKTSSLSTSVKNRDAYIQMLSLYEVALDFSLKELRSMVNRVAWSYNVISLIVINYKRRKREKNKTNSTELMTSFSSELRGAFEKTNNQ